MDHAKLGAEILGKQLIRRFLEETKWDEQIRDAIYWHSAYQLPENLKEDPFCRILRDADKLDILRANLETPLEDIYNVTTKELRTSEVTPEVMEAVKGHHTVLRSKKKSPVDHVAGHICLTFELAYPESRKILKEQGYLDRMPHFESENPVTRQQFETIREEMQRYLETGDERRKGNRWQLKVYILKKSIMKSSVDEYLEMKAEIKKRRKGWKSRRTRKRHWKKKQKKDLRAVFCFSTSDTALQALEIAGISYEGISIWMISSSARWSRSRNVSAETFIFQNSVMYLEKRYGCTFLQTAGTS